MKQCGKCQIEKEDTEFVFKNKKLDIRQSVCKMCQRKYKLKHYYSNKQAHYERNSKTRVLIKNYIDSIKIAGCSICNEKEIACIDFHHLKDKDNNIANLLYRGSLKKVKEEIAKCVLLCANCHRKVHAGIIQVSAMAVTLTPNQS